MDGRWKTIRAADAGLMTVVLAAALLAVSGPLVRGREGAKRALCSVNLKKYHAAMAGYLADNEERYCDPLRCVVDQTRLTQLGIAGPCQWHDRRASPTIEGNGGQLWPYMQTQEIMICETFRQYVLLFSGPYCRLHHHANALIEPQYSYSQNFFLGGSSSLGGPYGVLKEWEVVEPARTLVFTEETPWLIPGLARWTLNDTCFFARHPSDPIAHGDTIATFHGTTPGKRDYGRGNAVFVDGHVELCDPWVRHPIEGGLYVTESFYLAWPKGKVFTQAIPYVP